MEMPALELARALVDACMAGESFAMAATTVNTKERFALPREYLVGEQRLYEVHDIHHTW